VNLPLDLNAKTGILAFDSSRFKIEDFLNLIEMSDFSVSHFDIHHPFEYHIDNVHVLLRVQALDTQTRQSSYVNLYVKVNAKQFIDRLKYEFLGKNDTLRKFTYGIQLKELGNDEFKMIDHNPDTNTYDLLLKESIPHNTVLMQLVTYLNNKPVKNMHEDCELVSNSSLNEIDLYLKYDSINGSIKLIRQVSNSNLKSLNFSIFCHFQYYSNLSEDTLKKNPLNINIKIKSSNDKPPEIELTEQEIKNGQNLIILAIGDLSQNDIAEKLSVISSSTPVPMRDPRPAIPELNLDSSPADFPRPDYLYDELNGNRLNLDEFNKELIIRAYKLLNLDEDSKAASNQQEEIKVKFLPKMTSQHVIDRFEVVTNGSHLIFSKKNMSLEGNCIF